MAGQTYPEPSPYDRLILDQRVRFVGDAVAIVAGRTKEAVNKALKLIKVKYEVLEPVLDFHKAKDNPILVHPEENWKSLHAMPYSSLPLPRSTRYCPPSFHAAKYMISAGLVWKIP